MPSFYSLSDDDTELVLPAPKFVRSNQLLFTKLHVKTKQSFKPVKLYALDIELSSVFGKTNGDKLVSVKKKFYQIDGFGRALTLSKFSGIIRSLFTSELSLKRARELAIYEKIVANNNVRHVNKISDQVIVVKKILVDLPKSAVKSVFSKFDKVVLIKIKLIGLWQKALVEFESFEIADLVTAKWFVLLRKDSVCVAKAIDDKQSWVSRDLHRILLYTLPVGTTAHNLSNLLKSYGGKTCFIGHNPSSYVRDRCTIVCFGDETSKLAAIGSISVYKGVNLHWAGLSLALCAHCKQFGHISIECSLSRSSDARVSSGTDVFYGGKPLSLVFSSPDVSGLSDYLVALECSLELLADQMSDILRKLNGIKLVPLAPLFCVSLPAVTVPKVSVSNSDMLIDSVLVSSELLLSIVNVLDAGFGSNISKVLTTMMSGLKSKLSALDASVGTVLMRLDFLCTGAGLDKEFLSAGVAIIMDSFLAHHVSKVKEVSDQGKFLVTFLGLYAGASFEVRFGQASKVNSLITKVVNSSTFVVLGGNFNENGSGKSASFKFCLDLGLDADCAQWAKFKDLLSAKLMLLNELFFGAESRGDVDAMCLRNKHSFKFFGLELLVVKIVKAFHSNDLPEVDYLVNKWSTLNNAKTHAFGMLFCLDVKSEIIIKHLSLVHRDYKRSKMFKLKLAEEASIRKVIERHMENFCSDKDSMIRNVLEKLFYKVVLDYLVVDNELILEPKEVKLGVDKIMEE
ncbi:hypothetical protein G9A89_010572 [Geosiphon pyriformis]|nr:hypothetical protein G9A89_010572 [Geosiphon pyriformis]